MESQNAAQLDRRAVYRAVTRGKTRRKHSNGLDKPVKPEKKTYEALLREKHSSKERERRKGGSKTSRRLVRVRVIDHTNRGPSAMRPTPKNSH